MIRRGLQLIRQHPTGALVVALCLGTWSTIAVNAALLQDGPHPAPIMDRAGPSSQTVSVVPPVKPERWASHIVPDRFEEDAQSREREAEQALLHELQSALAERGFYPARADGLDGPLTRDAIRSYEEAAGLEATGRPTASLLAHIRLSAIKAPPVPTPAPDGAEPQSAEAIEAEDGPPANLPSMATLSEAAYKPEQAAEEGAGSIESLIETTGSLVSRAESDPQVVAVQEILADLGYAPGRIDGQIGASTRGAIRRFEADRGLPETGEISQRLLDELSAVSGATLG